MTHCLMLRPCVRSLGVVPIYTGRSGSSQYVCRQFPTPSSANVFFPTRSLSFVDQERGKPRQPAVAVDLRWRRSDIIDEVRRKYPSVLLAMPKSGPLFRKDIKILPENSEGAESLINNEFSKYSSEILKIPSDSKINRDYTKHQIQTGRLRKGLDHPSFINMKDDALLLTAYKSEIDDLVKHAKHLLTHEFIAKELKELDEETIEYIRQHKEWPVFNRLKEFVNLEFGKDSVTISGESGNVLLAEGLVRQLISSCKDPHNITIKVPITMLDIPTIKNKIRTEIENKPPSVTAWFDDEDGEIMISGTSSDDVMKVKDTIEGFMSLYTTKTMELDPYQMRIAERLKLLDKLDAFGQSMLYDMPDGSSYLEVTTHNKATRNKEFIRLFSLLKNYSKVQLNNELFETYLKVKARKYLSSGYNKDNLTSILMKDTVVFCGSNDKAREVAARRLETYLASLTVLEVPFPHPVYKNMVIGKGGRDMRNLTGGYPNVFTQCSDDSSKIAIVSRTGKEAHKFSGVLQERLDGFAHAFFSKLKVSTLLYRLSESKDYKMSQVTLRKVVASSDKVDEWLVYGERDAVCNVMEVLKENKRSAYSGKAVKQVRVKDYDTWHLLVLYAREVNKNSKIVKCMYDDKLASPPGLITIVGLTDETDIVFQEMQRIINTVLDVADEDRNKSKFLEPEENSVLVKLSDVELRIAGTMRFSFPNVSIRTNPSKTGLVITSKSKGGASIALAAEYVRSYFGNGGEVKFKINEKRWPYLKKNWNAILKAILRICQKHGVRFKLDQEDSSLTLLGPPHNTTIAKENIDRYFYMKHQLSGFNLYIPEGSERIFTDTVEIEAAKVGPLFDVRVGNFRKIHCDQVSVMTLPGKMNSGESYIRLTSSNEHALTNAFAGIRTLESQIDLKYIALSNLEYERARAIDAASPSYKFLFPTKDRKCWVKLDKRTPQFCIGSKSTVEIEAATKKLEDHFDSIEHMEQIDLVSKKMGVKMDNVLEHISTKVDVNKTRVLISERENKILVFGKFREVNKTTEALWNILRLEDWTVVKIVLDGCTDVPHAVNIKTAIMKSFPYLMIDNIRENPIVGSVPEDIVLTLSLPNTRLRQYPATFQSVNQLLERNFGFTSPPIPASHNPLPAS